MSKFSVNLKIGGNWTNGVTYIQQATIIVDGRTLKEAEEKAITIYCDDIIKQYGNINNLDVIYENYGKTTQATCSTCGKCVCEWSISAEARRMKKDESYKYARNYTGVRHYYNNFYNGYTTKNICYIAYDPEYNKAQTTEATEITETQTTEATETTETTEATAETTEATAETTETTAETTEETAQPDTAERGTIMKKYNIKVTACGVELNTFSNIPTSFTINKSFIVEAKDKEDAKQKGREKFIAETLYKGSIYGEYTGERRVAPFMEGFADDHSAKYEDITRNDYFVYRWQINVFVKQYRKPRTKPEAEATAQTTEATAQTTEATAQTTEATAQTTETQTTEATAQTTEATAQTTETQTTEATAETTEETAETTEETSETTEATTETEQPKAEETTADTKLESRKIYIVTALIYSGYHIEAVFDNKEEALKYAALNNTKNYDEMDVEEYNLSHIKTTSNIEAYFYYKAHIDVYTNKRVKSMTKAKCKDPNGNEFEQYVPVYEETKKFDIRCNYEGPRLRESIKSRHWTNLLLKEQNEEKAKKIFQDRFAQQKYMYKMGEITLEEFLGYN